MSTESVYFGVDVSKEWLDIWSQGKLTRIDNAVRAIRAFARKLPEQSVVAMEATNDYHLKLADICSGLGVRVYVINPRVTHHYQEALAMRGTTDPLAARAIGLFAERHHQDLRPYAVIDPRTRQLRTLLRRRSKLVQTSVQIRQSAGAVPMIRREIEIALDKLKQAVEKIDAMVDELMEADELRTRLESITGVGAVTSAVVATELEAREFATSDAFVAFCGLDPRPKDSGKHKGKRKLSKRGSRQLRTALFLAAMSASGSKAWRPYYEKLLSHGLAKLQAICAIARKLARIAWSIQRHNTTFDPCRLPQRT